MVASYDRLVTWLALSEGAWYISALKTMPKRVGLFVVV